jgi:hypothetical protein
VQHIRRKELTGAGLGLLALLTAGTATGQPPARPSDGALQAITQEGRRIASYHEAISTARKRLGERTDLGDQTLAIVVERGGAQHVAFITRGTKAQESKGFMLLADAVFQPRAGEVQRLDVFEPPKPVPADVMTMQRALETARTAAQAHAADARPPFLEAIFRDKDKGFTIYLQSRARSPVMVRFGADVRLKIGSDGYQVVEVTVLHEPGESSDVPPGDGKSPTLHSHSLGDLPTGTDVALVVENPRLAPHLVMTPSWILRIEADGALTWIGRNEVPPAAPGGGM